MFATSAPPLGVRSQAQSFAGSLGPADTDRHSPLKTRPKRMELPIIYLALILFSWQTPAVETPYPAPPQGHRGTALAATYVWTQLTKDAGYAKSYNYQLFADDQYIRAFHHDGVWISTDGATWRRTELTDIVNRQAFLDYVKFRGAVYALGTFDGNIERYTQTTQIARTYDFKRWEILARSSNLPRRFFYHPFVFHDKIWIIGGEDATGTYNDAWVSADAVHWTKAASDLPFGKRAGQQFVSFRDTLYMLDHDVWISPDALHWTLRSPAIAQGKIYGYSVEIFDNAIWLIGCNRNGSFQSEVLFSSDGKTWTSQRAPWTPRGGVATCIFKNQLIMTGGKYGGPGIAGQTEFVYSNDVWALRNR
jgi:hypothetical protein